jgi:hypothetical protein
MKEGVLGAGVHAAAGRPRNLWVAGGLKPGYCLAKYRFGW